ncbi:MAG: MFS transporter, partial [Phycisphaerae bacterium]
MTSMFPDVSRRHRVLYLPMFGGFVLFGLNLAVMGSALPRAIREFQWSYTAAGVVVAAGSVGYFVSTFLCGVLIRRLGPKAVIVGGLLIQAAGQGLFGAVASPAANVACMFFSGVGAGGTEVVVNYAVVHMEPRGESRLMNFMHAAFAVGAIASPFAMEGLLAAGARWQMAFRVLS